MLKCSVVLGLKNIQKKNQINCTKPVSQSVILLPPLLLQPMKAMKDHCGSADALQSSEEEGEVQGAGSSPCRHPVGLQQVEGGVEGRREVGAQEAGWLLPHPSH